MAVVTMVSLPTPPTTTPAILALIALALSLPWTMLRPQGGRCTMTRLICHHQGCCHWCHLCLHSRDAGVKEDGHADRQGQNANIHGWEEVGHCYVLGELKLVI
jgi:hypothetical protein